MGGTTTMNGKRQIQSRRELICTGAIFSIGLLAACGPASPPPSPSPAAKPTQAAPPPAAPTPPPPKPSAVAAPTVVAPTAAAQPTFTPASINVFDGTANVAKSLEALVKGQGFWQKVGLTANVTVVADGTKMAAGIVSGAGDIAVGAGLAPLFPAAAGGSQLKIIGGYFQRGVYSVYASNPAVTSVKDLEGKSVGISAPGALLHQIMLGLFKKSSVDPKKVNFVNVGPSPDVYRAVAAKKVDAGASTVGFQSRMKEDGVRVIAEVARDLPEFYLAGNFASQQAIAEKRDVLVRALAAFGLTFRFVRTQASKDPFIKAYLEAGGTQAEGELEWQVYKDNEAFAADLVISDQQLNFLQQINIDAGVQQSMIPVSQVADMSLAQDALKLMAKLGG